MNTIPFANKIKRKKKPHKLSASSDESMSFNQDNNLILTQNSNDEPEKVFRTATGHRKSVFNQRFFYNECPGGKQCKNYKTISDLELQVQKLTRTIEELTKINEYFKFALARKDKMYQLMLNEMNNKTQGNNLKISYKENRKETYSSKNERALEQQNQKVLDTINEGKPPHLDRQRKRTATISFSKKVRLSETDLNHKRQSNQLPKFNFENEQSRKYFLQSNIYNTDTNNTSYDFNTNNENFQSTSLFQTKNPYRIIKNNPYDKLAEITKRGQKNKLQNSSGVSFLALSDERLYEIASNPSLKNLYQLTLSDEVFINEFQNSSRETLINYCDIIGTITKDYQATIKLIRRIKLFMAASVELVSSVLLEDSTTVLINNTCKILDCERVSLFIHDRYSDMLVVHSAEGLRKNQIKVPKDKGIVGAVFMTGERLKIDDAYQDTRFNKEVDKMTNYRTRNIICYPLIDKDGDIFGAIQAINKRKSCFDNNDEEILSIFSLQASAILKNMMNMDANTLQISRLKMIIGYSAQIAGISSLETFADLTEKIVMELFSSSSALLLFYIDNRLYNAKTKQFIKHKNLGIVDYVCTKKKIHGCSNVKTCQFYNNLVDIPAHESLVTYPMIEKNKEKVIGVVQTLYNFKLSDITEKPKDNEMMIFAMIELCFIEWVNRNKEEINRVKCE